MLLFLVVALAVAGASAQKNCTDCEGYKCIEDSEHCGADGYPLRYGYKYCNRFVEPKYLNRFDEVGKEFILCVRQCLVGELAKYVEANPSGRCDQLEDYAFESHTRCFLDCNFCTACRTNKVALFSTYDFLDLLTPRSLKQIGQLADACGFNCFF